MTTCRVSGENFRVARSQHLSMSTPHTATPSKSPSANPMPENLAASGSSSAEVCRLSGLVMSCLKPLELQGGLVNSPGLPSLGSRRHRVHRFCFFRSSIDTELVMGRTLPQLIDIRHT